AFFTEFRTVTGLFDRWVGDCPLAYKSPNGSSGRDILGTWMLSILCGHWRYAHVSAMRADAVNLGLLECPWILDVDVPIKPLYGKQQGAVVGYNPHKPGRPSHAYHSYQVSGLRLMLGVDVLAGNQSHANHTLPGLVRILDGLVGEKRPRLVRGDAGLAGEALLWAV